MIVKPRPLAERLLDLRGRRFADPRSHFSRIHKQRGFIINPFAFASAPDPVPAILYAPFDGSDGSTTFTDLSTGAKTITATGTAALSTTQSKWGGSSLRANNSTGARVTYQADMNHGSGDFTYAFWVYLVTRTSASGLISRRATAVLTPIEIQLTGSSGNIRILGWNTAGTDWFIFQDYSTGLATSTWYHVAFIRNGSTMKLYIDGTAVGSAYTVVYPFWAATSDLWIGTGGDNPADAYIDDVYIKDSAVWTANFTPPTGPHA